MQKIEHLEEYNKSTKHIDRVYTPETHPVISVDLDDTMWENKFPEYGELYDYAILTVNAMLEEGYEVILWTARGDDTLVKSVEYLEKHGLNVTHPNFKVNDHARYFRELYPLTGSMKGSPKADASLMLDDKSYGAPIYKDYWHILHKKLLGKDIYGVNT